MASLEFVPLVALLLLIAAAAALYSSVGHGGASGYLAVMALFSVAPAVMKPAALGMNIAVATLVWIRLHRAGHFEWRLFWPLAVTSVPMAFLGGTITLTDSGYKYVVGVLLLLAAFQLARENQDHSPRGSPRFAASAFLGAVLGFLSGLTGVGGGIYLSPLLLLLRWTRMRANAAVVAPFIVVNSIAGLAGFALKGGAWPPDLSWFVLAALSGGIVGAELAVRRLAPVQLKKLLALVLALAAGKMFFTA